MPPLYRYPLDPTGTSTDNLVVGEEHTLSNRQVRCIAPTYGGYYTDSLIVTNAATNQILVRGTDYVCGELFEFPTGRYGKEICGVIVIKNASILKVKIKYQALGGDYSYSMDAIVAMIENLDLSSRPVAWGDIIGRPAIFDPASHLHDAGDIYGFEYVVHSIERLRMAILTGDVASHDEIYRYVDAWGESLQDITDGIQQQLDAHMSDFNNPHRVTKAQVGLGLVENLPLATTVIANAGVSNAHYVTPLTVKSMIDLHAVTPLNSHKSDKANPHSVTKTQVGLGVVENYPVATVLQAEQGIIGTVYMTPVLVSRAIAVQAVLPLNNHISDKTNPHAVTKAQTGLGSVENLPLATIAIANAGVSNAHYVTPLTVKSMVDLHAVTPLNNHKSDKANPHAVTKAQVGLGSVENYGLATYAEAVAGSSNTAYMTPLRTKEAIFAMALTNTNFTTPVTTTRYYTTPFSGLGGGYAFSGDANLDTGMFSSGENTVSLRSAGVDTLVVTPGTVYTNGQINTGTGLYMSMGGDWSRTGAMSVNVTGAAGDANLAGIQFHQTSLYAIRMGLRGDGYFGIGGASRAAWSWYTDPSGNMTAAGDVTAYSDPRLKENFDKISSPFEVLNKVNGYSFNWKNGIEHTANKAGTHDYGLNALEVYEVLPEAVKGSITIEDDAYLTVSYDKFIPFLIEAVKQQQTQIQELMQQVTRLSVKF